MKPRWPWLFLLLQLGLPGCVRQYRSLDEERHRSDGGDMVEGGARPETGAAPETGAGEGGTSLDAGSPDLTPAVCKDPVCDLWPQCGCPASQKCESLASGQRKCTPAGTALHGEACSGLTAGDCSAGTTCISYADWPDGLTTCFQYCNTDADCFKLGLGAFCKVGTGYFMACTIPCDLVAQTGCPSGSQCSPFNFGTSAGTMCTGIGGQKLGEACGVHFDCGPGMACVGAICQTICILGGADTCPVNTTCTDTSLVIAGSTKHIGACL